MSRQPNLLIGDWTVDPSTGQAMRGGQSIHLAPRAVDLLRLLVEHPGEVLSIDRLMDEVWGDTTVNHEVLYSVVAAIRRAFGDDPRSPKYIETIPKRGYRLVANVRREVEPQVGEAGFEAISPSPITRMALAGAVIATAALVVAVVTLWVVMNADRNAADDQKPTLRLALLTEGPHLPGSAGALRQITDDLAERLVRLEGVEITATNVPLGGARDVASYSATGRALDADAVLVVKSDHSGRVFLNVLDPDSASVRASIEVDGEAGGARGASGKLVARLAKELDIGWHGEVESGRPIAAKLGAREQEILGRYYLQRRFDEQDRAEATIERAIDAFRAAIELDPDFVAAREGLALALVLRVPHQADEASRSLYSDQARQAVQHTLSLEPDSAEAYAALGLLHVFDGDQIMARAALERSRELDPDNPATLRWSARLLTDLGEFQLAAGYARRAAELAPFSTEVLADAAMTVATIGDCDLSIQLVEALLALAPTDTDALNNLVLVYRDCGHLDKAIELAARMQGAASGDPRVQRKQHYLLGIFANLYVEIDAAAGAEALVTQAEREHGNSMYTYWARSCYLLATGDRDTARAHVVTWPLDPGERSLAALVASHATMAGLNEYARSVLEAVPEERQPMQQSNPFLVRSRWLTVEQLEMGALSAVYKAYLDRDAGNPAAADARLEEAREFLDYWIIQNVATQHALYFRAAVHALQGRPDDGVADLTAAIDAGFLYAWRVRIDPILDGLRGHPGFDDLLLKLEQELAAQRARIDSRPEPATFSGPEWGWRDRALGAGAEGSGTVL